ncbi:MAG: DUF3429 domain-containing protein [Pseudomonadota bacterium]
MTRIPTAPLLLGLAGLLPFLWGVATLYIPEVANLTQQTVGPRFLGPYVQIFYGTIILAFMSGVLWGFATQATGPTAGTGYALSVLPALWAFFFVGGGPTSAATFLAFGFIGLLGLDWTFWRFGLAPKWWMSLRILLTTVVVLSLLPAIF